MAVAAEQDDAIASALRAAIKAESEASEPAESTTEQVITGQPDAVEDEPTVEDAVPAEAAAEDDVASLKARLEEREREATRYREQLEAVQARNRQSQESLNSRAMKFASQRDRARQLLERALSPDGVDKSEAERLLADIRGGYNPASANYEPPQQVEAAPQSDDRDIAINEWLNDNGLTQAEATSFDTWIRTKATLTDRERRLTDPYTLLTSIAPRWREASKQESVVVAQADDNTRAVKTVARVQKQAAKAASAGLGTQVQRSQTKPSGPVRLTDEQLAAAMQATWDDR